VDLGRGGNLWVICRAGGSLGGLVEGVVLGSSTGGGFGGYCFGGGFYYLALLSVGSEVLGLASGGGGGGGEVGFIRGVFFFYGGVFCGWGGGVFFFDGGVWGGVCYLVSELRFFSLYVFGGLDASSFFSPLLRCVSPSRLRGAIKDIFMVSCFFFFHFSLLFVISNRSPFNACPLFSPLRRRFSAEMFKP